MDIAKKKNHTSFLNQNDYDVIVNVLDATNLERNLILSAELLSLNKNAFSFKYVR